MKEPMVTRSLALFGKIAYFFFSLILIAVQQNISQTLRTCNYYKLYSFITFKDSWLHALCALFERLHTVTTKVSKVER